MKFPKSQAWCVAAVVLATLLLDQLSKWWLLDLLAFGARAPVVVTDFFSLVMVWNHGISFGMLNRPDAPAVTPYFLIVGATLVAGILLRLALRTPLALERVAYAMVAGGALGNVVDRLRFGAVADFFYVHWGRWGWPAFNVADAAICIGVGMLLLAIVRAPRATVSS